MIWLTDTAAEGSTLGNDPANLGPLKLGSKVNVSLADLNDWCYIDRQQQMHGGFTIAAVQKASRLQR